MIAKKIPGFLASGIKDDFKELEKLLARLGISLVNFINSPKYRQVLGRIFPRLAKDVGWEYLRKKAREEVENG